MAIRTPLARVHGSAALFARRQGQGMFRGHGLNLMLQNSSRPDAEQQNRHGEESQAADTSHQIRHAQKALHDASDAARLRRGATLTSSRHSGKSRWPFSPVTSPAKRARKPPAIGKKLRLRISQYGRAARTESIHGAAEPQKCASTKPAMVRSETIITTPASRSQYDRLKKNGLLRAPLSLSQT